MEKVDAPKIKRALDTNTGLSNIIEKDDIARIMHVTFEKIATILEDHCGPYGNPAMIPNEDPLRDPKFTKDGMNIVKAIDFVNPMELEVQRNLVYVASKIERISGDGTTSSTIIACDALKTLQESMPQHSVTFGEYVELYNSFITEISERLNNAAIKASDDMSQQECYAMCYNQAMTSSHGNKLLSTCVADILSNTPIECWKYTTFRQSTIEEKRAFFIETDEHEFISDIIVHNGSMFNAELGTAYKHESADVFIYSEPLYSNSLSFNLIREHIDTYGASKAPVMIMVDHTVDQVVRTTIDKQLAKYRGHNIMICYLPPDGNNFSAMRALVALLNMEWDKFVQQTSHEFKDMDVYIANDTVYISGFNMYDAATGLHKHISEPGTPIFNFVRDLDETLNHMSITVSGMQLRKIKTTLNKIRNRLVLKTQRQLVIGGDGYDNEAAFDVVEDTLKAVRDGVVNGVVLGGYATLRAILIDYMSEAKYGTYSIARAFVIAIARVMCASVPRHPHPKIINNVSELERCIATQSDMYDITYDEDGKEIIVCNFTRDTYKDYIFEIDDIVLGNHYMTNTTLASGILIDVITGMAMTLDKVTTVDASRPMITQPVSTDLALLRRFGEVMLKFLFVQRIIVPNGVNTNSGKE